MNLHPIFKLRDEPTEGILQLLESVTLGTNGAMYRHLDTRNRIHEVDNPLFLSMERHSSTIGNITFCKRDKIWYIRYFAFDKLLQSSGKENKPKKEGLLRRELNQFFDTTMEEGVDSFYAYIDPQNKKSLWMSENFGFQAISSISTQTFSRVNPKNSNRVSKSEDWEDVKTVMEHQFKNYLFYNDYHLQKGPFYVLKDSNGEVLACLKYDIANWRIDRLPGKMGNLTTNLIPYIPFLNKLINPKQHRFLVPEAVYVKDNNPQLLDELYSAVLAQEELNLIIWWVDTKDSLYSEIKNKVNWGLLNKMIGQSEAKVVVKTKKPLTNAPVYTIGIDFI